METADSAFARLENAFPAIRRELISRKFENWKDHLDFLLRYVQMMRARSILFFEHLNAETKNLRAWTIQEISPDRRTLTLRSMIPEPLPDSFVKNWAITTNGSTL